MGAEHCGGAETAEHCDGEMGEASAVCLTHHASQDAYTQDGASEELPLLGGSREPIPISNQIRKTTAFHPSYSGRAPQQGVLLHARIGVWLE